MSESPHIPVLLQPVLAGLLPGDHNVDRVIDGTLGAGGHTRALLNAGVESILGLDVDPNAIEESRRNLAVFGERVRIVQDTYLHMAVHARARGWDSVEGILLDLGVSSMQVDSPERGFSFLRDGPLDMRFDPSGNAPPASELVNTWDERELAEIFSRYGEERYNRRIAAAIVKKRPYKTTLRLAEVIAEAIPKPKHTAKSKPHKTIHPATRVFQALRIAINDELQAIERALPIAIQLLAPGGRLAVISFHSLEDRIVKRVFKDASTQIISPPGMVLEEKQAMVRLVTRKPVTATEVEIAQNPRSRSAKLRIVEKL